MGLITYVLIVGVAVLVSLCDAFPTTSNLDKLEHSSIKYSSYGATKRIQNRGSLRYLESADSGNDVKSEEEERGLFSFNSLKKLIPGTSANTAAKAAKAKKAAEQIAKAAEKEAAQIAWKKAQFEKLAASDDELYKLFPKWKEDNLQSSKVLDDLIALGLDTPKYLDIGHRYQIYLNDLAHAAKLAKQAKKAKESAKVYPLR